jgi:hypothetical protein
MPLPWKHRRPVTGVIVVNLPVWQVIFTELSHALVGTEGYFRPKNIVGTADHPLGFNAFAQDNSLYCLDNLSSGCHMIKARINQTIHMKRLEGGQWI